MSDTDSLAAAGSGRTRRERETAFLTGAFYFGLAVLRASLRDRRGLVAALGTPLAILAIAGMSMRGQPAMLASMSAAAVGLAAVLAGSAHSTRVAAWREQGVLERLACTPVPLSHLFLGAALAQAAIGVIHAALVILVGVVFLRLPLSPTGALLALGALALGSACFVAYGSLVAQMARRAESANAIFVFTLLPMFFLGGAVPAQLLPEYARTIGLLSPMGMMQGMVQPLLTTGSVSGAAFWAVCGLLLYTIAFSALASWTFRLHS